MFNNLYTLLIKEWKKVQLQRNYPIKLNKGIIVHINIGKTVELDRQLYINIIKCIILMV